MPSVVLRDAAVVFQELLNLKSVPAFRCTVPPGVETEVPDITGQFLGLGFSGVYLQLEDDSDVLVQIGVVCTRTQGRPLHAYFAGGRSIEGKALVGAVAIATARLVGSPIQDGSGHWMPQDYFSADELRAAMVQPHPPEADTC